MVPRSTILLGIVMGILGCDRGSNQVFDFDADGDGYASEASGGIDCDDGDGAIHPGAAGICGDGVDDDCNGVVDDVDLIRTAQRPPPSTGRAAEPS